MRRASHGGLLGTMVVVEGQVDVLKVQAHLTQLRRDQHHVHEERSKSAYCSQF